MIAGESVETFATKLLERFIANTENTHNVVNGHQTGFAWRPTSKKYAKKKQINMLNM